MNKTRALALPVIAVMAATLLAGCGNTKDSAKSPASMAPSAMMSAEPTMSPDAMMSDDATPSEDAMMSEDATMSDDAMASVSPDAMMSDDANG